MAQYVQPPPGHPRRAMVNTNCSPLSWLAPIGELASAASPCLSCGPCKDEHEQRRPGLCDRASEIIPGRLFLGGASSARDVARQNTLRITHVLNVSDLTVLLPGSVR